MQPDFAFMDDPDEAEITMIRAHLRGEAPNARTLSAGSEASRRMRLAGIEPDHRVFANYIRHT